MLINIPDDVRSYILGIFSGCNDKISGQLSTFPAIHEGNLDMNFISYFAERQYPIKLASNWIVRIDVHFIGGGRHFANWEVADIAIMMIFRRSRRVLRSKIVLIQSKKLYADPLHYKEEEDPRIRQFGLGRLLVSDEEHQEIIAKRQLSFDDKSIYGAFKKDSRQQNAMQHFQQRFSTPMFYMFYNPWNIPHTVTMPLEEQLEFTNNKIGMRIVPKDYLDSALSEYKKGYSPSFKDLRDRLLGEFTREEFSGGWRLEYFVSNLMIDCKQGLIDDSPNFDHLVDLMQQKRRPMSAAISITFDSP